MKRLFQVLVIVDSLLLAGALVVTLVSRGHSVPLLTAVLLAGLNAAFQAGALKPLPAGIRATLGVGGIAVALTAAVLLGARAF